MSREIKYQAIILKKQPLGEADEIITFFTKEAGKLRALAKSSKLSSSKLQHVLQSLFQVKLTLARSRSRNLFRIIRLELVNSFSEIRQNLPAAKTVFYFIELTLKFTADEHKNLGLYNLLVTALSFINKYAKEQELLELALAKFKIEFLKAVGLGIHYTHNLIEHHQIHFSNSRGSFVLGHHGTAPIFKKSFGQFLQLGKASFDELPKLKNLTNIDELQKLLTAFLEYQLEREIKAQKFLEV